MELIAISFFTSMIILGIIIMLILRYIYVKYSKLKVRENPSFNKNKYQYSGETFVIKTQYIKEEDFHPVLIKLKKKYNLWIKRWWYLMGVIVIGSLIIFFINLIFSNK